MCESCDTGYHDETDSDGIVTCVLNACSCQNGEGTTGLQCSEDNTEMCATCDDGYLSETDSNNIIVCIQDLYFIYKAQSPNQISISGSLSNMVAIL